MAGSILLNITIEVVILKKNIIFSIIIILILIATYIIWKPQEDVSYGHYIIDFQREYTNDQEKEAIHIAESINYSEYIGIPRFDSYNDFNFIDIETIRYFNNTVYENMTNKNKINIIYQYYAKCRFFQNLEIQFIGEKTWELYININNNEKLREVMGVSLSDWGGRDVIIALINSSGTNFILYNYEINDFLKGFNYNISFNNVYLIEMSLTFEVNYPEYAYVLVSNQMIILDKDYNLNMIVLFPSGLILF